MRRLLLFIQGSIQQLMDLRVVPGSWSSSKHVSHTWDGKLTQNRCTQSGNRSVAAHNMLQKSSSFSALLRQTFFKSGLLNTIRNVPSDCRPPVFVIYIELLPASLILSVSTEVIYLWFTSRCMTFSLLCRWHFSSFWTYFTSAQAQHRPHIW